MQSLTHVNIATNTNNDQTEGLQNRKILAIDDDLETLDLIDLVITRAGGQVYRAISGEEGLRQLEENQPDLVILDLMMPGMDGWETCTKIREISNVPIVILTVLEGEANMIRGLEHGAIDYLIKPFTSNLLLARLQAILRQLDLITQKGGKQIYEDDHLTINLAQHQVLIQQEPVKLTPTEYRLLSYLVVNAGQVLTFEQILDYVWGWERQTSPDYVHVYISSLRRKLEENPKQPKYLVTEYGLGYRFEKQI